jgi:hypothetical protein
VSLDTIQQWSGKIFPDWELDECDSAIDAAEIITISQLPL